MSNNDLKRVSWFFAAIIQPRDLLSIFEKLPIDVLAYLRHTDDLPVEVSRLLSTVDIYTSAMGTVRGYFSVHLHEICGLHSLLMPESRSEAFRNTSVFLADRQSGGKLKVYEPPHPSEIGPRMSSLVSLFNQQEPSLKRSIRFFWDFVNLHPFIDGNGRTARIISGAGLGIYDQFVLTLFHSLAMFHFKKRFSRPLRCYQKYGDYNDLDKACSSQLKVAVERVLLLRREIGKLKRDLAMSRIPRVVYESFLNNPLQPCARIDRYGLGRSEPLGTDRVTVFEVNGSRFYAAESLIAQFERMRPFKDGTLFH